MMVDSQNVMTPKEIGSPRTKFGHTFDFKNEKKYYMVGLYFNTGLKSFSEAAILLSQN